MAVAIRESMYLLTTLALVYVNPSFFLVDWGEQGAAKPGGKMTGRWQGGEAVR